MKIGNYNISVKNPIAIIRKKMKEHRDNQENERTVYEAMHRIQIGEYVERNGSTIIALMIDGIFIQEVTDGNVAELKKKLRDLRNAYIEKRWQGDIAWVTDLCLDAAVQNLYSKQPKPMQVAVNL